MKTIWITLAMVAVASFVLAGCSKSEEQSSGPKPAFGSAAGPAGKAGGASGGGNANGNSAGGPAAQSAEAK